MTQVSDLDRSKAWQWLVDGWHALRDKAISAVTYFTPQRAEDQSAQRWGVLATDVTERSQSIHVELELPGLRREDLSVEVFDDQLVVRGEKRSSDTRREGSLVVTERAYGQFQRVLALPCPVDADRVAAKYKRGVLSIDLPKARGASGRGIQVRRG